ncbi:MAG: hypothetical protein A3C84_00415 [Candidatus Ryanbacteria bacterium RIFCSPHIGHO2_02_FULL_48_12]|uniref:Uncharacterized protein n=1 Tax=Candidatus Ryanbacteria bacterium RIFCSPHIGHO2_01_FULL_48_27 TaxID=1802115 RepID=A0A1G2G161_9BACT|nr:MAG: hypothetical protein A2756_04795 [Candidatus Ryanbacteria bacterium RIFCSPHIGHO2_01_FULL_48_27]OGZ50238.1 MAG: hypothetical protein A3C84_00415 [Candidatus Ryanbacteria bacterium RIFCSPHIGHO2_02_FULL_48_12]
MEEELVEQEEGEQEELGQELVEQEEGEQEELGQELVALETALANFVTPSNQRHSPTWYKK